MNMERQMTAVKNTIDAVNPGSFDRWVLEIKTELKLVDPIEVPLTASVWDVLELLFILCNYPPGIAQIVSARGDQIVLRALDDESTQHLTEKVQEKLAATITRHGNNVTEARCYLVSPTEGLNPVED